MTSSFYKQFYALIFRVIPKYDLILLSISLLIGIYGALASSYSSFSDLVDPKQYVKPCWLDASSADEKPTNSTGF